MKFFNMNANCDWRAIKAVAICIEILNAATIVTQKLLLTRML